MSTRVSRLPAAGKAEVVLLGIFAFAGLLRAQSKPGEFDVASIHPSGAKGRPSLEFSPGGGIRATNVTLKLLIQMAYDIRPEQLSGGPGWTDSEEYTLVAKAPEGPVLSEATQMDLTRQRLQALLKERFQLAFKIEANPAAGYILTVARKGHTMTLANDPAARQLRQVGRWEIRAEGIEMPTLVRLLSVHLRATVVDRTGLEGRYNFHLNWNPGSPVPSAADWSAGGLPEESLIPAVQEQLGLRLEPQKVATDRYTIERAEKPAEN